MLLIRAFLLLLIAVSLGVKGEPEGANFTIKSSTQVPLTEQITVQSSDTAKPAPKPTPAPTGLARVINDIFQIPITVLRTVSNFLSNNFGGGHRGK